MAQSAVFVAVRAPVSSEQQRILRASVDLFFGGSPSQVPTNHAGAALAVAPFGNDDMFRFAFKAVAAKDGGLGRTLKLTSTGGCCVARSLARSLAERFGAATLTNKLGVGVELLGLLPPGVLARERDRFAWTTVVEPGAC